MTKDEEQIAKAKENIAEKGSNSQTEQDRIDESVGEQEHLQGNEDSQSAKDRVHESEGAENADENQAENKDAEPAWLSKLYSKLDKIAAALNKSAAPETAEDKANEAAADKLGAAFGVNSGVFPGTPAETSVKKMTTAEVADTLRKIM